jgi:diguanylate cyclase (GGDEF)-like protein
MVIESRQPLIVPDVLADPRWTRREGPQPRSGMWVPLVAGDTAIGLVSAYREAPGGFTDAELDLLKVVARYVAGAIEVARLHEQVKALASTDALTGLANRRTFLERLRAEIERSRRAHHVLSVGLIDLDRFKDVNDTHGHAAGDAVLLAVARRLRASVRAYDLTGRVGGDEFAVLFPETSPEHAATMLDRLGPVDTTAQNTEHPPGIDQVGFSWGIAGWPGDGEDAEGLLRVADGRLYDMKRTRQAAEV